MYKELLQDYEEVLRLPVVNCFKEIKNGRNCGDKYIDYIEFIFKVDKDNPLQSWSYYKDTFDEMSYEDRSKYDDEEMDGDSYAEATITYFAPREFKSEHAKKKYWKTCWCGHETNHKNICPKCKIEHSMDYYESIGEPTERKPFRLRLGGCDDSSYSKVFATLEEAMKHVELIKRIDVLDSYEWIDELGYEFTN